MYNKIHINSSYIKLDSFLKLAGVTVTGGQAKGIIKEGKVYVNGEVCLKRGKKLFDGDRVTFEDKEFEVIEEKEA